MHEKFRNSVNKRRIFSWKITTMHLITHTLYSIFIFDSFSYNLPDPWKISCDDIRYFQTVIPYFLIESNLSHRFQAKAYSSLEKIQRQSSNELFIESLVNAAPLDSATNYRRLIDRVMPPRSYLTADINRLLIPNPHPSLLSHNFTDLTSSSSSSNRYPPAASCNSPCRHATTILTRSPPP